MSRAAVPGALILRDPERHGVVRRSVLADGAWRAVDFGRSAIDIAIDRFLASGEEDCVIVVRSAPEWARQGRLALGRLRDCGLAE
jgi:hypothetical protein